MDDLHTLGRVRIVPARDPPIDDVLNGRHITPFGSSAGCPTRHDRLPKAGELVDYSARNGA